MCAQHIDGCATLDADWLVAAQTALGQPDVHAALMAGGTYGNQKQGLIVVVTFAGQTVTVGPSSCDDAGVCDVPDHLHNLVSALIEIDAIESTIGNCKRVLYGM